jgi:predicted transcriptional regulator
MVVFVPIVDFFFELIEPQPMPIVSVKLADETKLRLNRLAANQGVTPHALMVDAIESALSQAEQHQAFVAHALRSRKRVLSSGQVIDGAAFGDYLRAKVRGQKTARPKAQRLDALLPRIG